MKLRSINIAIATFVALALTLFINPVQAALPDALLILDFEGGTPLADKSPTGTATESHNGALGVTAGEHPSSTPGNAGNFDGGAYLKIPGIHTHNDLRAYTLSAWLKPNDLSDRYVFGQDSQGFHIGIRAGGRLHQAHWGSDKNADTQLANYDGFQDDGWVHATYTYDTDTKISHRYLDGVLDGTSNGDHNPPNQGSALMIGRMNGGQDGNKWLGLLDDIAVFNVVFTPEQVTELYEHGPLGGSRVPLMITAINTSFSAASPMVTISFNSRVGKLYAVDRTTDLLIWEELDDGVEGKANSTDYTDSFLPEDSRTLFYRVREVE